VTAGGRDESKTEKAQVVLMIWSSQPEAAAAALKRNDHKKVLFQTLSQGRQFTLRSCNWVNISMLPLVFKIQLKLRNGILTS
jgi:hypothetical protein